MFDATLGHAKRTIAASELLLANLYFPQAYSLGHIAVEELSKARLLFAMWLMSAIGWETPDWPGFWKAWADHGAKNRLLIFARVEEELRAEVPPGPDNGDDRGWSPLPPDQVEEQLTHAAAWIRKLGSGSRAAFPLSHNFHQMRLRAMYVDFAAGRVLLPEETATQPEIEGLQAFAHRTIQGLEKYWQERSAMKSFAREVGPRMMDVMIESYFGEQGGEAASATHDSLSPDARPSGSRLSVADSKSGG